MHLQRATNITLTDRNSSQRGVVLAAVLACLLVVGILGAALVQRSLAQHRSSILRQRQAQAMWLAESALSRALAQLQAAPDYRGETWQVAAEEFGTPAGKSGNKAVVKIRIETSTEDRRKIVVKANYDGVTLTRTTSLRG